MGELRHLNKRKLLCYMHQKEYKVHFAETLTPFPHMGGGVSHLPNQLLDQLDL